MIFPIVYRSLRGRSGAHKKRAAQITADMTHMVSTPTDLIPYLSRLSPQLELLLTDGSPEVRLTSGKTWKRHGEGMEKAWRRHGKGRISPNRIF
jgi:hypothetical protein